MKYYLGIDVGSVSTNVVVLDEDNKVIQASYIRTKGNPIKSVQQGMQELEKTIPKHAKISAVGVTGSARYLIQAMTGADIAKNEITAHAIATTQFYPDIRTIIEIGGQDSKLIILNNGIVNDFAMNNVCAAGTGSFLDQQASRLGIPIENFAGLALESKTEVRIAGRCTVFAESDMIHKQQLGYQINDIINGLCESLVRNYFNTVGKGKDIRHPIAFQGGVAANLAIRRAFERYLGQKIIIPEHYNVMGAIGAAIIARKHIEKSNINTTFKGLKISECNFKTTSFVCQDCPNTCEVVEFFQDGRIIAHFGDKCGKYSG